jgi:hypothetical protein
MAMAPYAAGGFAQWHLDLLERLRQPLAAALEPTAMRRSSASLLRRLARRRPADAVLAGAIRRGDRRHIEAAILLADLGGFLADLGGFTAMSECSGEADLLAALDRYFEAAVIAGGGAELISHGGPFGRTSPVRRLDWLGRQDSNLRMPDPKSGALPLGDAPKLRRT